MAVATPNKKTASKTPLSSILPPLIFGTATFNHQFHADPFKLETDYLVQKALSLGIRAFDTSPYYGPSEPLLGAALSKPFVTDNFPRSDYFILTKVGRIAGSSFDYSPQWIRTSIARSLKRLNTTYLDVVYCHDVEFVPREDVLEAVKELRRIRDEEGTIKYVGISGYPLPVLCSLAQEILETSGEPVDAVQSYAHFTLQNSTLSSTALPLFQAAKVDVVTNASPLGMGLLRRDGVPIGGMGDFHPAPAGLRKACQDASDFCTLHDERLEVIALRYSLETWLEHGSPVGSRGDPALGVPWGHIHPNPDAKKMGVSVIGVSTEAELDKTMRIWRSILDGLENGKETALKAGRWRRDHEWSLNRKMAVRLMAEGVQEILGDWHDFCWDSPPKDFVNERTKDPSEIEEEETANQLERDNSVVDGLSKKVGAVTQEMAAAAG